MAERRDREGEVSLQRGVKGAVPSRNQPFSSATMDRLDFLGYGAAKEFVTACYTLLKRYL